MIRAVLYISVLIIFAVALVIINNALVMATLERMPEIGTLRAVVRSAASCSACCWWRRWRWACCS